MYLICHESSTHQIRTQSHIKLKTSRLLFYLLTLRQMFRNWNGQHEIHFIGIGLEIDLPK